MPKIFYNLQEKAALGENTEIGIYIALCITMNYSFRFMQPKFTEISCGGLLIID